MVAQNGKISVYGDTLVFEKVEPARECYVAIVDRFQLSTLPFIWSSNDSITLNVGQNL